MTPAPTDALRVVDASALVAMLVDDGPSGAWATDQLTGAALLAPALMPFEATNILRRLGASGLISADQANQAFDDLADLPVELWDYAVLADRMWALRENLTSYDAAYVAVAEVVSAPLVTLDEHIRRAPGLGCEVHTPCRNDAADGGRHK